MKNWKYIVIGILAMAGAVLFWFMGDYAIAKSTEVRPVDWLEFRIGFPFIGLLTGLTIGVMNLKVWENATVGYKTITVNARNKNEH